MNHFIGTVIRSVDTKGRVCMPRDWRVPGLLLFWDGQASIAEADWSPDSPQLVPRWPVEVKGRENRFLVPLLVRERMLIGPGDEVVMTGCGSHILLERFAEWQAMQKDVIARPPQDVVEQSWVVHGALPLAQRALITREQVLDVLWAAHLKGSLLC